jgi:hypothetical protein
MSWLEIGRKWRPVMGWWSLVCLAAACGGGNDGGTGPGGGGGGQLAGDYLLVGANDDAVPTMVESNGCSPVQVVNGGMTMSANGNWQMQFNWQDGDGDPKFTGDHGHYRQADDRIEFTSEAWGDQFEGEVDGGLVWLYYDFCEDTPGEDLDLAFSR